MYYERAQEIFFYLSVLGMFMSAFSLTVMVALYVLKGIFE